MKSFDYRRPATIDEARRAAEAPGAAIKAGGIDLLDLMKEGVARPDVLVNLLALREPWWRAVGATDDGVRVGALVTLAELADAPAVPAMLRAAAGAIGTPAVRNVATVGGNLLQRPRCWYLRERDHVCFKKGGRECFARFGEQRAHAIFDVQPCPAPNASSLAPVLLALDARAFTDRRTLPMERLYLRPHEGPGGARDHVLSPGEILTAVEIPAGALGRAGAYREARDRAAIDFPLVSAAVSLQLVDGKVADARIGLGGVAPIPRRAEEAEEELRGKAVTPELAGRAARAAFARATPLPLGDNAYKATLGEALLRRAVMEAAAGLAAPR